MQRDPQTSEETHRGSQQDAHSPHHVVALKLPQAEWKMLRAIAATEGIKPGPYSTRVVSDHLRQSDLASGPVNP